ncbi:PH domain-containing protein [Candidatus Peregrinibacteria bacterium]|nr:PH domain-containing protein [Candidatus Peregrinibacteria bacterium]
MEKELKQSKPSKQLDILVRPTPVLLFAKILVVHSILAVFMALSLSIPQFFTGVASLEMIDNFRISALLILMLIGEVVTLVILAHWLTEFYVLKNDSLTHRYGIFIKHKRVLMIKQVVEVLMKQGFFGKVFNYGTITLTSLQGNEGVFLKKVENPGKYFKILRDMSVSLSNQRALNIDHHLDHLNPGKVSQQIREHASRL